HADPVAEGRAHFERGNRAVELAERATGTRRQALLTEAHDAYVESLKFARNRNVLFNAAVVLAHLERFEDAFGYFTEYLAFEDLTPEERQEATRRLTDVATHVLVLDVASAPTGASVRIDREDVPPRGTTPLTLAMRPGAHRLRFELPGYEAAWVDVEGDAGERQAITEELRALPIMVTFRAPTGSSIEVDSTPAAADAELTLVPGDHSARVLPNGTETKFTLFPGDPPRVITLAVPRPVVVAPGPSPAPAPTPITEPRFGSWPTYLWVGAGVLGATAVALAAVAVGENNDYESNPTESRASSVDAANLRADIVGGAALAVGITALVLTLLNDDVPAERPSMELGVAPIAGGAVLGASWRPR
ncbi:MAG: PEGA domain-containing protein, partial [Myxococcales bacterium]|nr:PEGA domain-containing protein [Myxococcales bacterium]